MRSYTLSRLEGSGILATRIGELRRLVVESKDLSTVSDYFDSELVELEDFINAGVEAENEPLVSLICSLLQVAISDSKLSEARMMHLKEHGLWHGLLQMKSGRMAMFVYFEDINRGTCTVAQLNDPTCHHLRFSMPDGLNQVVDPELARLAGLSKHRRSSIPS